MTADSGGGAATPSQAAPLPLAWHKIASTAWRVSCSHCHTELTQGPDLPDALELAKRNATARPCCPAWRDIDPPAGPA